MTESCLSDLNRSGAGGLRNQIQRTALVQGEILVQTRSHSAWGGAVTAQMYLPLARSLAWQHLTDYPKWVQFFPDVMQSKVLQTCSRSKQLYQVARKTFLCFTAQVEVYLHVIEKLEQQIDFQLEKGSFLDFTAELKLQDWEAGTVLTYSVQATPTIPIPTIFIQQAMHLELPANMRTMRQVLCA